MAEANTISDKRRFTRVPFVSRIELTHDQQQWSGNVVDISFNGVLINCEPQIIAQDNQTLNATLYFDKDYTIHAKLKLAHHHDAFYGFYFDEIDSDSLNHLQRIISYNLGNMQACERELMSLFSYHQ